MKKLKIYVSVIYNVIGFQLRAQESFQVGKTGSSQPCKGI